MEVLGKLVGLDLISGNIIVLVLFVMEKYFLFGKLIEWEFV